MKDDFEPHSASKATRNVLLIVLASAGFFAALGWVFLTAIDEPGGPGDSREDFASPRPASSPVAAVRATPGGIRVSLAEKPTATAPGDWKIYRGNSALQGVAGGKLGNSFRLLWKFRTNGAVRSSPVIADGRIFVGSSDGYLYAIDPADGKQLWSVKLGKAIEAPPSVAGGIVYIGDSDGVLHALDAASGRSRWTYRTDGEIFGAANFYKPAGDKGARVIVGSYDNALHCVDASSGRGLWKYKTGNFINGSPAVAGGIIVFAGCDAKLHVVDENGKIRVTVKTGSFAAASPALVGRYAFVGNYTGRLLCIDTVAGKIAWEYGQGSEAFFSSPAIGSDRIVVGSRDGNVHCVDRASGKRLWLFETGGEVDSSPVICDGKVVFGSGDGRLYVVRLADGEEIFSYELGEAITSSPAVADGKIVIGCDDGWVYAFGPKL